MAVPVRGKGEAFGLGVFAGMLFAVMEVFAAVAMGSSGLTPFRMFSSVVLGRAGLEATPPLLAFFVGTAVHLLLSGLFGWLYGLLVGRLDRETRTSWARQIPLGLIFGAALWLVNFQLIARALYPWFLEQQLLQLVMHALFFGLPLALLYLVSQRQAGQPSEAIRRLRARRGGLQGR